ncbi:hypothetical protein [Salinigranum sp.]|uniref:DUF7344 domain-containing protein n=1 Tax=Salinigranum sp. TaxID=1966351 RepID=UPI0035639A0C
MSVDATDTTPDGSATARPHEKPTGTDAEEFGPDEVFHLLQNQRRRDVLRVLRDVDETVEMSDVAEQVAAWEHDTTVEALTSSQRQRVYISLYQRHLPKLDDAGVIDYEQSRGRVTPRPRADSVGRYLEPRRGDAAADTTDGHSRHADGAPGAAQADSSSTDPDAAEPSDSNTAESPDTTDRWAAYSLVASVLAAVGLTLTAADVSFLATLPNLSVAAATVATFFVLSVARLRD